MKVSISNSESKNHKSTQPFFSPNTLQPKLTIGQPNDKYEQEADAMADRVMHMPLGDLVGNPNGGDNSQLPQIQTKCSACEQEEMLQKMEGEEEEMLQTKPLMMKQAEGGGVATQSLVNQLNSSKGGGSPLPFNTNSYMSQAFGNDFSHVKIHTDSHAIQMNQGLNARAFTHGSDIYFNKGEYSPNSSAGKKLLAHELTHVVQQGNNNLIQREANFDDNSCNAGYQENIREAWETAVLWINNARRRLNNTSEVSGRLQAHFKIDPENTAHSTALNLVKDNFNQMAALINRDIDNRCVEPDRDSKCHLGDGRQYAAYVHRGTPEDGIWHCTNSTDTGFLGRYSLIETIVHEIAHLTTNRVTDHAYHHQSSAYQGLTRQQAIHNADSYSQFAQDLFLSVNNNPDPLMLSVFTGGLLSAGTTQWVIGASVDARSRTGLEVFDLVGGVQYFVGLDGESLSLNTLGLGIDVGVITRSPDTHFFADIRTGAFFSGNLANPVNSQFSIGPTLSNTIGWADNGFRAGVNLRLLYDVLNNNNAAIIGGNFTYDF